MDLSGHHILSACGDGTLQVWEITDKIKRRLSQTEKSEDYLHIDKALYNYQVLAQEDIMHTV